MAEKTIRNSPPKRSLLDCNSVLFLIVANAAIFGTNFGTNFRYENK